MVLYSYTIFDIYNGGMSMSKLEQHKQFIIEQYQNPQVTQIQIAKQLGVNPSTLNRYARSIGITKVLKTKWSPEKIEWLKENYNLTYKEMESHLELDSETIRMKLKELNLQRTTKYRPFKIDMNDLEFISDLDNPRLTAPDIVEKYKDKYGIGESRIHQLRKERGIKLQINTLERISSTEKEVMEILDSIDVIYLREKRIGKYSVDFYLGFKICIEAQGGYWHNKPCRKETDARKKEHLESLGYKIIYVWENAVDKEYIVTELKKLGLPIQ